ncbi:type IV pilus twitching motility protein PilT [Nitratiruptor sp. SB155-2]|uniref:type IV pilus twitching motility protein PilT n=1 Tax=Nitratiruptor sp. (strain SB155-2) TaxID=387092 RepID=UPI0001586E96|nr:type IV pilus twitching motility protein PilT [Nitratiruptor sp. SB155-2]BAF69497.1 twitching motility protein PilT [Nitratiruptor sp. SB155-2]
MLESKYVDVSKLTFETTKKFRKYLKRLIELGGSDVHLKAGSVVRGRVHGEIIPLSSEVITRQEALTLAKELLRTRFDELVENKDIDFTYIYNEQIRFRGNLFFQINGISGVFRVIPTDIKSIDELGLPLTLHKITQIPRGLVLVTGVTGSGKSTTLAALIDEINSTRKEHIITIEDPVEFVHQDKKSIINQRNIGQDAKSFSRALKAALREDPDVILVGEMRDLETIEMALHAAETGHLVFSTLHTLDAKETINRIVSVFPPEEQNRIRMILASVLEAVISQRLVRKKSGGRIAAVELLLKTKRIESIIAEGRDLEITEAIEEGKIYGMQTFDQALLDLYKRGLIDMDTALENATSPSDMKLAIKGIVTSSAQEVQNVNVKLDDGIIDLKEEP